MTCSISGCDQEANVPGSARGWCRAHYHRWQRYGDPTAGDRFRRPPELVTEAEIFAWFMPGVPPPTGCWDWTAMTRSSGYGEFNIGSVKVGAHVVSHRIFNGPTHGLKVLHSCDRPICVQPTHLHLGTQQDNIREMIERGRMAVGENLPQHKLTESDIFWIREQANVLSQRELANIFGVTQSNISNIQSGKTWKHLL